MPRKREVIPQLPAWSWSKLHTFRQCPARARFSLIDKYKEPEAAEGSPLWWGDQVHRLAERYVSGALPAKPLPTLTRKGRIVSPLELFEEDFRALRRIPPMTRWIEEKWAVDAQWNPVDWSDWDRAAGRFIVDLCLIHKKKTKNAPLVLKIIDYKTGKIRPENEEQLELGVIFGFHRYDGRDPDLPYVDQVRAEFWYLDEGVIAPHLDKIWTREDLPALQEKWETRILAPYLNARVFPANPGEACTWCPMKHSSTVLTLNGVKQPHGPCKF